MGGVILDQALPFPGIEQIDPFLLIHHFKDELPGKQEQRDLGVGPHPHRGFSPVTFVFEGEVQHRDSRGNDSTVSAGGTQWMESGMGIIHSERPSVELARKGGTFEIVQFWINTPASRKMEIPKYQALSKEETPSINTDDKGFEVAIVSGSHKGVKGPIKSSTNVLALRLEFEESASWQTTISESQNTLLYVLDGQLSVNGMEVGAKNMVWFSNEGELIHLEAIKSGRAILLAGNPINESMTHYGPFVMNTETEIMEALRDYQMGKMGILIEQFEPPLR